MLGVYLYGLCWLLASAFLLWKAPIPERTPDEAPRWLFVSVLLVFVLAVASVWPLWILIRIAIHCWHHLGHPR